MVKIREKLHVLWFTSLSLLFSSLHTRQIIVKPFSGSIDVQKVRVTPMDALAFDDGVESGVQVQWTV